MAAEAIERKARDYEVLAASHAERAELAGGGAEHREAATAFAVAAIVLHEVADALSEDEL
jgi:hypothetical protein